eukprot:s501_g8.t1
MSVLNKLCFVFVLIMSYATLEDFTPRGPEMLGAAGAVVSAKIPELPPLSEVNPEKRLMLRRQRPHQRHQRMVPVSQQRTIAQRGPTGSGKDGGLRQMPGAATGPVDGSGRRPPIRQAWMLLQDAGLEYQERNTVIIANQGDMTLQRVAQELRNQFSDHDLKKRDGSRRHQGFAGERLEEDEDEDDGGAEPEASFVAAEELTPEGLAMRTEAEDEVQTALAALHQARRTLRGARDRQKQVKQSRQYFKVSSSSSRAPASRDDKITCLRCGATGHKAAACPAPQPKVDRKEMAPFVCYVDESDEREEAWHANETISKAPSTLEAMMHGKAVVDCGATKSLGSVQALERIMALSKNGISEADTNNRPTFGFGNSSEDT